MRTTIVIPAREGSTRFPGKPQALILGKQLLLRTWEIAKAVKNIEEVIVATDSVGIKSFAETFGGKVIMTRPDCNNGTERVYDAISHLTIKPEIIINLQGDAVLTPPWVIQQVVDAMLTQPQLQIATPATHLDWKQYETFVATKTEGKTSGTLVVTDLQSNALYFSKGIIPHLRSKNMSSESPFYRHIGLYGYRLSLLEQYSRLKPTPLEQTEQLEQLRILENGIPIKIIHVDYHGRTHWSVDNPEDVQIVEKIIKNEGELIQ